MENIAFVSAIAILLGIIYAWAFKHLPGERWQVLGSLPHCKQADGRWLGLNLTYYGLINACAVTFAVALILVLLAACGLPAGMILATLVSILLIFTPFAKWTAVWVEKKRHTLSIGGASFCGLVAAPLLLLILQGAFSSHGYSELPVMHAMSALSIGYALGEGSGRLACLSFGCCYGKPMDQLPPWFKGAAVLFSVTYQGHTKKIAYAQGLTGQKILAVPAMTAVLYSVIGLMGTYLFLVGHPRTAYLLCILVTQIWRFLSEFLRADYRGGGGISVYQYMAAVTALTAVIYRITIPVLPLTVDLSKGLLILWKPLIILTCQILWFAIFLFTGRSKTTAAHISLFVRSDRI